MQKIVVTERLRLTEMKAAYLDRHKKKITNRELSKRVFSDAPEMEQGRRDRLMSAWDGGKELGTCHLDRIQRLAKALKCTVVELAPELAK